MIGVNETRADRLIIRIADGDDAGFEGEMRRCWPSLIYNDGSLIGYLLW